MPLQLTHHQHQLCQSLFANTSCRTQALNSRPALDQTQWEHPHLCEILRSRMIRDMLPQWLNTGYRVLQCYRCSFFVPWSRVPLSFWSKIISLSFASDLIRNAIERDWTQLNVIECNSCKCHVKDQKSLSMEGRKQDCKGETKESWKYKFCQHLWAHPCWAWVRTKGSSMSSATWVISTRLKGSNILQLHVSLSCDATTYYTHVGHAHA